MYSISPTMADNYASNASLNSLLDSVDRRIAEIAIVQLNNTRFGFRQEVNFDQYDDLLIYKEILMDKLMGCNCLDDQFLIKIVSKLKKLIK